jgi:cell division cycle 2-like protein
MGKRDRWDSSSDDDDGTSQINKTNGAHKQPSPSPLSAPLTATPSNRHNPLLHGCRSVYDTYEQLARISEGTYGVVWKARSLQTREIVALKQIKVDNHDDFSRVALREINALLELSGHSSIVSVQEMVVGTELNQVFQVMEYFEFDLHVGVEQFDGALAQGELKSIAQQILSAVAHVHAHKYLHRDLKPENILVRRTGQIAIADFGLARNYQTPQLRALTVLVVTLWYRAPELLFGEDRYGPAVDMWSVGCIFGELICKEAVMQGQGELDQIDRIFQLVGTPNDDNWPSFQKLPNAGLLRWKQRSNEETLLHKKFPIASPVSANQAFLDGHGYDLLAQLLTLDPDKRLTAQQALEHDFFLKGVKPTTPRFFSATNQSNDFG